MRARSASRTVLLIALLVAVPACGGGDAGEEPAEGAAESSQAPEAGASAAADDGGEESGGEAVTLEWLDYFGTLPATDAAINDAIAAYEEEHPNVTINRTSVGFADLRPQIIQGAASGTLPDIMIIDNPDHQAFAAQGALADITEYVSAWEDADQYFEGPWASTMFEDRNYGVPFESNATALYVNTDMLAEAGISEPPATWEELRSAAQALTEGTTKGFCFSAAATEEGTFTFLPFLWQAGGDVPTIGDAASVEALRYLDTLVNEDASVPESVVSMGQADVFNQWIAGQCGMMINGPWQLPEIEEAAPDFAWDVVPWPANVEEASILGGENYAIGAGTDVEAAWDVLEWLSTPERITPILTTVGLPNREDMVDGPEWSDEPLATFVGQVAIAKPRAYGPEYPQISETIWTMVQRVLTGDAPPEQAAQEAGEAIQPLLPESGG